MRRGFLTAVTLLVLTAPGWVPSLLAGQETKMARGTVSSVAGDTITVKVADKDMKFNVDNKTTVEARGAGTKNTRAQALGMPGPKISEVLKTGEAVEVSYTDLAGTFRASRVRAVSSVGSASESASEAKPATKTASGTVKSVAADSLMVSGADGKDMTFAIDSSTRVVGRGAGTKAAAKGGKTAITDLIATGDRVTVSYHDMNGAMHASQVRVTTKAKTSTR